jgi:hypothetical protein
MNHAKKIKAIASNSTAVIIRIIGDARKLQAAFVDQRTEHNP